MKNTVTFIFILFFTLFSFAQKDSLQLGDRYSEDQLYLSINYAQFFKQPNAITKSSFSYGLSVGFMKDITLNKQGNFSFALGFGYGFDFFNHQLKVEELNGTTVFNNGNSLNSNVFKSHNLEFPIEIRWRTSTAKKYKFWRIYTGIKFIYNLSNHFDYTENNNSFSFSNVSAYKKLQYGLTLSTGYDAFNLNVFYSLTPLFENATFSNEELNTGILKFGLIFYIL
ncbi:MAG: PorT family protein [Flavobacteriaceae bacterium]|nr:PorT family protein [Flavobacteriaceae bacterium]